MADATDVLSAVQALEGHVEPGVAMEQRPEIFPVTNIEPSDKDNVIHAGSGPMTLLSVQLDAHDDPHRAIIAQALREQPEGTQLIVHIQDGSTKDMQVLLDGNLIPVSRVSDVINSGTSTTTALPPPAELPPVRNMPSTRFSKTVIQRASSYTGNQRNQGKKRKRHQSVVIDEQTQLSGESFKSQLLNTSDTIKGLDLAPPTKLVMEYTSTIDLDTLFGFPSRPHSSKDLLNAFSRNLAVVRPEDKSKKRPKLPKVTDDELSIDITSMIANHDFGLKIM